jgi:hypothetical protein
MIRLRALLWILIALVAVGCESSRSTTEAAATSKPASLEPMAGRWRVESSSGHRGGGYVFFPRVGERILIEGDVLVLLGTEGDRAHSQVRKTLTGATQANEPGTFRVEIAHRGNFSAHDPIAATAEQAAAASKGWSRHGLVRVAGDVLLLAVSFPQDPPPTDFEIRPKGPEVVRLKRVVGEARPATRAESSPRASATATASAEPPLPDAPETMPVTAEMTFEKRGSCQRGACPTYAIILRGDGRAIIQGMSVGPKPVVRRVPVSGVRALWAHLREQGFFTSSDPGRRRLHTRDGTLTVTWGGHERELEAALFSKARRMADELVQVERFLRKDKPPPGP